MHLHGLGKDNDRTVVMIHGACMRWDMFMPVMEELGKDHRVISVAVDGMDPDSKEDFTSVEELSEKLEGALTAAGVAGIDCLYGLSMGGAFVLRMLADDRIPVKRAVMDGGIAPYELPYHMTRAILLRDFTTTVLAKRWGKGIELAFPPERYTAEVVDTARDVLEHMSARSIWRVFASTDNFTMPERFPDIPTEIHYWYGEDEKRERRCDIGYIRRHVPGVRFRVLPGMAHGQYVMTETERFCEDIRKLTRCGDEPQ